MRDSVCALDGLLPHPSLHPLQSNRHHIVGLFLAESRCHACQSRPWCYHCADHDHPNGLNQRGPAKDILCQVHRCLPGRMFLHGVRFFIRSAIIFLIKDKALTNFLKKVPNRFLQKYVFFEN